MAAGRKSLKEEIQLIRYMTELAGPTFDYLKLCVTSGEKADKQWAVEQLMKLYPKALPNEVTGENGEAIKMEIVKYADNPNALQVSAAPVSVADTPTV